MKNLRADSGKFSQRAAPDGAIKIAGYINKFGSVDSYGTRFDPSSVRLERFMQNPILLFNHDVDAPIGRMTFVEPREDGIWGEAIISASAAEKVAYVRDLVSEGCLKAFSFRFNPEAPMEKDPEIDNAMIVKNWELQEVSIVSLPAQPESIFSLRHAQKAFANVRSLDDARKALTSVRGAKVAKCVNEHIKKSISDGLSEEDVIERLRDKTGLPTADLAALINGEVTPCPDTFLAACVEELGCNAEELDQYNAEDVEASAPETINPSEVAPAPERQVQEDDALVKAIAETVTGLVSEGKTQDEAVAFAINLCSAERGCTGWRPSAAQFERILEMTTRQATQEPGETTPVKPEVPNDNAMLQKFDSLISLVGALINEVKALKDVMAQDEKAEVAPPVNGAPPPAAEPKMSAPAAPPAPAEGEPKPDEMSPEMKRSIEDEIEKAESRLRALGL